MTKYRRHGPGIGSFLFLIITIATLIAGVFLAIKFLPQISPERFERFDRYTFVINQEPLAVVSLFPSENRALVILVPTDLYVNSAHGYGQIKAGSVFAAGELDHRGNLVLKDTLSDLLGLNVSQVFGPVGQIAGDKTMNRWVFFSSPFWKQVKVDNFLEMAKIAKTWSTLRTDKVKVIDLGSTAFSSETILADGSSVQTLDQDNLDNLILDQYIPGVFRQEGLRVGVINSTATNGLGNRGSRILSNAGVDVVAVETQAAKISDCEAQYSDQKTKSTKTLAFVSNYFSCHESLNTALDNRFDIEIILGSRFEQGFLK